MTAAATHELFAVAAPGLEEIVASELRALGIDGQIEDGGVAWQGDDTSLARAVLHLRCASRVLVRIARFRARGFPEFERHLKRIEWDRFTNDSDALDLRVTSRKSRLYHERAIAERLLRVIGLPELRDDDDDAAEHAQMLVVRFLRDECTLSADAAGALHRRGYRQRLAKAPLRETLAAAMLHAARADAAAVLDPMCGSGTIPIEAVLRMRRIAPGLASADRRPRRARMLAWKGFAVSSWDTVVDAARAAILPRSPVAIVGSDRDAGAVAAAVANAERAGVADDITFERRALSDAPVPDGRGLLAANPPYGVRVGRAPALRDLYAALGNHARRRLAGWHVALLCADRRQCAQTGLALESLFATRNGGIPVELMYGRVPEARTSHETR